MKRKSILSVILLCCVGLYGQMNLSFLQTIKSKVNSASAPALRNNMGDSRVEILVIGDSNTEYDYMTRPLKQEIGSEAGKGYRSFSTVLGAMASSSGLTFSTSQLGAGKWQEKDMNSSSGASGVDSPTGLLLYTSNAGAALTFGFNDSSIDLYYLSEPGAGSFKVYIDDTEKAEINTDNSKKTIKKASFSELTTGAHTLKIVATGDNPVSVCGVDVGAADVNRTAVHNWGNEGVTAEHFVNRIPEEVFSSALKELDPTYVVILIGTNDGSFTPVATFKNNLQTMAARVKSALPNVPILIMSPLPVKYNGTFDTNIQSQYRSQAYSVIASDLAIDYWDNYAFWGSFDESESKGWRRDDLHWNITGGTAVAKQLVIQTGRTPLRILYDSVKDALKGNENTSSAWNTFVNAKDYAKSILDAYETTQSAMDEALNDLLAAVSDLALYYPDFYETISPMMSQDVINIPKGTYSFNAETAPLIKFSEKTNVQINGNGSTIICSKPGGVFRFENCENITVSDFTFDCYPRTSTQGTITGISGGSSQTLEVEIHKGYEMLNPDDEESRGTIMLFDKENRELIRNFHTAHAVGEMSADNDTRKVTFNTSNPKSGVYKVGDYVTFSSYPNGSGNHLFQSDFCKDMKFKDIIVHDTRGATFLEHYCHNSYYYRCVVDRKKNDPLYEEEQLRTTDGDIIHAFFATKGPKVEECTFKYMCDDGINIGGFFYGVYKVNKARKRIYLLLTSEAWWIFTLKTGDAIVCVGNDGSIKGKAVITAIDKPSTEPTEEEIRACTSMYGTIRDKDLMKIGMSIQVDEWDDNFDDLMGGMVYAEDRVGNGFEIINCYMGHNRSRAALIKASNGLIKGNIFRGAAMPGISIAPEYYWLESGISHNLEITENLIEDCMFDSDMKDSGQLAGLSVVSVAPKGGLTRTPIFENIIIHRNIIRGCPKPSVFLNAMSGYYYENTVEPDENMVRYHGYDLGVSNRDTYVEKYCGNIIKDKDPSTVGISSNSKEKELIRIDENGNLILVDDMENEDCNLTIYDISGKAVICGKLKKNSPLSLNELNKGGYIVNLKFGNQFYSWKYIIK